MLCRTPHSEPFVTHLGLSHRSPRASAVWEGAAQSVNENSKAASGLTPFFVTNFSRSRAAGEGESDRSGLFADAKASRANDVKRFGCAGSWAREAVLRLTSKRVGLLSL